ncbi:MAG: putative cardiolipin synthase YwiE [Turneriella sp.]|nr:putative cardiolipin synthase YwiE [Turneriella sp.]
MPSASNLVLLWNRSEEWKARLEMVEKAERFVYISVFYIEYDVFGKEFLLALERALARGVKIYLLIDSFGQWLAGHVMPKKIRRALQERLENLRKKDAKIIFYKPPRRTQRMLGGGQHVKIQLSDSGVALFGSSNVSHSSYIAWNDFSALFQGSIVLEFIETLNALGLNASVEHQEFLKNKIQTLQKNVSLGYLFFDPNYSQGILGPLLWRKKNPITKEMLSLIENAQASIQITSFYFKPTQILLDALIAAAKRGVRVEIYHSHRKALDATDLAWIAAAVKFKKMLSAGINIFENLHGEHSKILLVDDKVLAFGSYNFEDAAHDRLAEAMVVTGEKKAIQAVQKIFTKLRYDKSNIRVKKFWKQRLSYPLRFRIFFWGRFKRWL